MLIFICCAQYQLNNLLICNYILNIIFLFFPAKVSLTFLRFLHTRKSTVAVKQVYKKTKYLLGPISWINNIKIRTVSYTV